MPQTEPVLPLHIEETISTISEVHEDFHRQARPLQKSVARTTAAVGRPAFLALLLVAAAGWIGLNLALRAAGQNPPDPPPFAALSCVASVAALFLTAMVLATQKHDDEMERHRDQLTLELAILSDQKSAKIIRLLEELRHNDPLQGDHRDEEAQAMAIPADPKLVLEKIRSTEAALRDQG